VNGNLTLTRLTTLTLSFCSAGGAKEDTFYLSYVVAATRPIGKPALALGAFALATPFIEGVTGVPRDQFLSIIQGSL